MKTIAAHEAFHIPADGTPFHAHAVGNFFIRQSLGQQCRDTLPLLPVWLWPHHLLAAAKPAAGPGASPKKRALTSFEAADDPN